MQLIKEIEIAYFRSFYKFKLRNLGDLNVIFGKNDSGKSNLIRALSLFFSGNPDHTQAYDFVTDFCDQRLRESDNSDDIRKFLYVKITFNTPKTFQRSLGSSFYVKRQWTVSRGKEYLEEVSSTIPDSKRHILTRLMNKIRFIHIPAIKDLSIFEMLLTNIYETLANAPDFEAAVENFSTEVQNLTSTMFSTLPTEVSGKTKIGVPTQMRYLFETLDFETIAPGDDKPKSLTRQRGDGIKARHIPELLNYISEHDEFDFHIWGFEEPENSLDFVAAQAEAERFLSLAKGSKVQVFMTTHSPSFYLLKDERLASYYVSKNNKGLSVALQGRELEQFDVQTAVNEGFYLPAVAEALQNLAAIEARANLAEANAVDLKDELLAIATPVILTEGRTDAAILITAWEKLRGGAPPFRIRSCETGVANAGSGNGGAQSLAVCLKGVASDHPHAVIGLFDYDEAGIKEHKLNKNFVVQNIGGASVNKGIHGKSYAALLPIPVFRAECGDHKNLPIEFLFRDEHLATEVGGSQLTLKSKQAFANVGGKAYKFDLDDVTHLKDIGSGKTEFANTVVPSLPSNAFDGFAAVFDLLEAIIEFENDT
ncbi:MAG: AAA family ATPase [Rhodobacteraceae bacterium]|nr:AAA family ATPase [Paracoccaceae bacterium]